MPSQNQRALRVASSDVRHEFQQWLINEFRTTTRLIILEGLTGSGKTTLTKEPFDLGTTQSKNIELDDFLPDTVPEPVSYLDALDRPAISKAVESALCGPTLVIVQGAIAWPAIERLVIDRQITNNVRRVYLKRMARLISDYWQDEEAIFDRELWPPTGFHRSIYKYHADTRPWTRCDLIIERIEELHDPKSHSHCSSA
jgi:hypothetical protein